MSRDIVNNFKVKKRESRFGSLWRIVILERVKTHVKISGY